jgi:hypothetical protein
MQQQLTHPTSTSRSLRLRACVMAAVLASADSAWAGSDDDGPSWTFGGFGTIGVAHSSEKQADYTSTVLKASGAGHTRSWSPHLDTGLGAQLSVTMDKRWSGVLQLTSAQNLEGNYKPIVEWANIKYQATPDLSLRFGRIALPIFLAADYRKVGYAYPWVRTPVEFYGAIPITNSDGVDASYRWNAYGVKHTDQVFYGHHERKLYDDFHLQVNGIAGLSHSVEYGALSGRLSYLRGANLAVDLVRPLFDGFRQFGPQGDAIADKFDVNHKRVNALSVGANYDTGHWFLMGEISRMNSRSYLGQPRSWYVSSGYRFDNFTTYASYARTRSATPNTAPGLDLSGLPPLYAAAGAQLNGQLAWLLTTIAVQDTLSVGVRWDLMPSVALKAQLDRVRTHSPSVGTLQNTQAGFVSGRAAHVASFALDFVF